MVIDFINIKEIVNELDHSYLNDIMPQSTAECLAKYLCEKILHCYKVKVVESKGNEVIYAI